MSRLEAALELQRRRQARNSLLAFTHLTFPDFQPSWHHELLCDRLDRFARGELTRIMVMMPPRHSKSELVSRRLPAYLLGRNPDAQIMLCSYSADLASRMNRDVQRIIDSPAYRRVFPGTRLRPYAGRKADDNQTARTTDMFELIGRAGTFRSTGVGGSATGFGYLYGIIDDPVKNREEAESPVVRDKIWEWYSSTFLTRQAPGAGILITATRWHEDDLCGRLLRLAQDDPRADQWEVVRLPAVATHEPAHPEDPRSEGEALWPDRFGLADLEKIRVQSEYDWNALYQQDPRSSGSTEWPSEHFGEHIWFSDWPNLSLRAIAVDASKGRQDAAGDYTAIVRMGRALDGTLFAEADLQRMPAEQIVEKTLDHCLEFKPDVVAIEANCFQELLAILMVKRARERGIPLPVLPVINNIPKHVRIRRLGPYLGSYALKVRATAGGRLLVDQLRQFPLAQHDDGPDACEMALRALVELWNGRQKPRVGRLVF